jgi:DNA-binding NarL/FixJ family response regulator
LTIRILIADDHDLVREGLRYLLHAADFEVAGEAADCESALRLACELPLDLVLLDLTWSCEQHDRARGFDLLSQIKAARPEAGVVIYSAVGRPHWIERCRRLGADGYVVKSDGPVRLLDALRRFARGESLWNGAETVKTAVPVSANVAPAAASR